MSDRDLMAHALALAARARGATSPNPMVGAVVVKDGAIVGEGWHHRAGEPHAEIEALRGVDARGATIYVTLEPCCHYGRTGPCTKALIAAGVARVVVAATDPNPLVAGRGLAELAAAGIAVESGVLADEARALNRAFEKWILTRRPFVTLKLATSLDGYIARAVGETTALTGALVRRRVHALRAANDAVMVGAETALVDRPRLTVREAVDNPAHRPPWRIVVDSTLRVPLDTPLFAEVAPGAIVATTVPEDDHRVRERVSRGIRVYSSPGPRVDLGALFERLGTATPEPICSILVEGGGVLGASLLAEGHVDELIVCVAPTLLGAGVPGFPGAHLHGLALRSVEQLGEDAALTYGRA